MCKRCQIYFIRLKKTCLGCFRIEEIRDQDNETGLKEGGVIEMSTTVLPLRDARSFAINTYHDWMRSKWSYRCGFEYCFYWTDVYHPLHCCYRSQDCSRNGHCRWILEWVYFWLKTGLHFFQHTICNVQRCTCSKIKIATQEQCSCKVVKL